MTLNIRLLRDQINGVSELQIANDLSIVYKAQSNNDNIISLAPLPGVIISFDDAIDAYSRILNWFYDTRDWVSHSNLPTGNFTFEFKQSSPNIYNLEIKKNAVIVEEFNFNVGTKILTVPSQSSPINLNYKEFWLFLVIPYNILIGFIKG